MYCPCCGHALTLNAGGGYCPDCHAIFTVYTNFYGEQKLVKIGAVVMVSSVTAGG